MDYTFSSQFVMFSTKISRAFILSGTVVYYLTFCFFLTSFILNLHFLRCSHWCVLCRDLHTSRGRFLPLFDKPCGSFHLVGYTPRVTGLPWSGQHGANHLWGHNRILRHVVYLQGTDRKLEKGWTCIAHTLRQKHLEQGVPSAASESFRRKKSQ